MKWWKKINWVGLGGSLMLLVGFFLSWVKLESIETPIAGWQLGGYVPKLGPAYYAAYALPFLALLIGGLSIKKPRWATGVGLTVGLTILGWAIFEVVRLLYTRTFAGLWVSLLGAGLLFIGGLLTWRRGRQKKKKAAEVTVTLPGSTAGSKPIPLEEPEPKKARVEAAPEEPAEELPELTDEDMAELDAALGDLGDLEGTE